MAITNFKFPGVTFEQTYADTGAGTDRTLAVACIGKVWKYHALSTDNATRLDTGSTPTIPTTYASAVNSTVANSDIEDLTVVGGLYSYMTFSDTDLPTIVSSAKTMTFASAVAGGDGVAIGYDELGNRGLEEGDPIYLCNSSSYSVVKVSKISATSSAGYNVVKYSGNLPEGAAPTSVAFCLERDNVYAGTSGVTVASGTATVSSDLSIALPELESENNSSPTGTLVQLSPDASSAGLYIEYREAPENNYVGKRGIIDGFQDLRDQLGKPCAANPLALACEFARLAGRNAVVYYTGVNDDEDATDYETAIDFLANYDDVYSVVPCTTKKEVIRKCMGQVVALSSEKESKVRMVLWYGVDAAEGLEDAQEVVDDIVAKRKERSNSERGMCVWADGAEYDGELISNYALAAAAAGMRSYEPCQRPLSNLGYSFFGLKDGGVHGMTRSKLAAIAREGVWIIAENSDGTPINMRQLTTAASDNLNMDEESIISNADTVALDLMHVGEDMVGNSNISPTLLALLEDLIRTRLERRTVNDTGNPYVGPQLLAWELVRLWQDPVNLDHVYAEITITPPKPFNRFHMTMRVL